MVCKKCNNEMKISHYLPDGIVTYVCDECRLADMRYEKTGKEVKTGHIIRRGA